MNAAEPICYCSSGKTFAACCGPLLQGLQKANTAEQLMRSRYCAFARNAFDYLVATHHTSQRSANERDELVSQSTKITWLALDLLDTTDNTTGDTQNSTANADHGEVEFKAWFNIGKDLHCLHERSRFVREESQWYYVDAVFCDDQRISLRRNETCFCGSNRKYKHCHAR